MKKLSFILVFLFSFLMYLGAQDFSRGMKYQAVARDLKGEVLVNSKIELKIILLSKKNGQQTSHYSEVHSVTTNELGLFTLVIGEGKTEQDDFEKVPWSSSDIWMEIQIKPGSKSGFTTISNSQLLAVPYAFHALTASQLSGNTGISYKTETAGVPAQVWSLKGNSKTDPAVDKLGTTDYQDLVLVTNNLDRFRITKDGNINIKENLIVDKNIEVSNDLYVKKNVFLNTEGGSTISNGPLSVTKKSATSLSGTLNVEGVTTVNNISNLNGQVTIKADLPDGIQENYDDYPLRVEGGKQGVAIKITGDKPGREQNWITFFNENNEALGRIEGSKPHLIEVAKLIVKEIFDGGEGVLIDGVPFNFREENDMLALRNTYFHNSYTQGLIEQIVDLEKLTLFFFLRLGVLIPSLGVEQDPVDVIDDIVEIVISYKRYFAYLIEGIKKGVAFESGGADYAEWLKKANPSENISFGEVVGVKGGLISKTFLDADQFMAITSNPIIVGAMPEKGNENGFEKVALMGQVPILVYSKVLMGDYILPSGFGDGTAIAVNPKLMKANDFSKVIGVAWSASEDKSQFNYINTAVGFNANQMGMVINNMQIVMNKMQDEIAKLNPAYKPVYFDANENSENNSSIVNSNNLSLFNITDDDFISWTKKAINQQLGPKNDIISISDIQSENLINKIIKKFVNEWGSIGQIDSDNLINDIIKKYLNHWGKVSDINPDNIIRKVVERLKEVDGKEVDLVLELINDYMKKNIVPKIQSVVDHLFENFIDLTPNGPFENFPEIKNVLRQIKDNGLFNLGYGLDDLQGFIERVTDRINIFHQLVRAD